MSTYTRKTKRNMTVPSKVERENLNYLKPGFWQQPANHFWENDKHTQQAKEYFRSIYGNTNHFQA